VGGGGGHTLSPTDFRETPSSESYKKSFSWGIGEAFAEGGGEGGVTLLEGGGSPSAEHSDEILGERVQQLRIRLERVHKLCTPKNTLARENSRDGTQAQARCGAVDEEGGEEDGGGGARSEGGGNEEGASEEMQAQAREVRYFSTEVSKVKHFRT
jgi:hypothetical protein